MKTITTVLTEYTLKADSVILERDTYSYKFVITESDSHTTINVELSEAMLNSLLANLNVLKTKLGVIL